MIVGVAPPFALIVIDAAGVEAEIAADRSHDAMGRTCDLMRGLRDDGIMRAHGRMVGEFGERHRGADLDRVRVGLDRAQLRDLVHLDQHGRRDDAAADIHGEIGAAAERPRVRVRGARFQRFVERGGAEQGECGEGVHLLSPGGR